VAGAWYSIADTYLLAVALTPDGSRGSRIARPMKSAVASFEPAREDSFPQRPHGSGGSVMLACHWP
jgi:hypothetical protein